MSPAPVPAGGQGGRYELGFQLTPLTMTGGLDTSGDLKPGPHPAEEDNLYKMAVENRDGGNKMVQAGQYEMAIGRYSELIMQTRALDNETDIVWTDAGRIAVRQLRATAYLNLSLCFLKTEQWTHATNTATRAMQGDKDPADPKDDVLAPEKKAKALFRRAQAQSKGFNDLDKALTDLKKAHEYAPDDASVSQELRQIEHSQAKASKAADKKMAGFLASNKKVKDGEGLFDDKLRPKNEPAKPYTEPMKLKDGLWVMPNGESKKPDEQPSDDKVDYEELSREINEMRESNPEEYDKLRVQVQEKLDQEIAEMDKEDEKRKVESSEQDSTEEEAKEQKGEEVD